MDQLATLKIDLLSALKIDLLATLKIDPHIQNVRYRTLLTAPHRSRSTMADNVDTSNWTLPQNACREMVHEVYNHPLHRTHVYSTFDRYA